MTSTPFPMPDILFGWAFYAVLVSILIVASVIDFRSFTIPKTLTISCLVLGLLFNLSRGLWLGIQDKDVWKLVSPNGGYTGWAAGALDGFLFSLAGFAFAFVIFFSLWFLRGCGGGDVKLFAAVGAWVGPWYTVFLLIGSVITLIVVSMAWMIVSMVTSGFAETHKSFSATERQKKNDKNGTRRPKHRGMTYSFPIAFATAVLLLLVLSKDLGLVQSAVSTSPQPVTQNVSQAR